MEDSALQWQKCLNQYKHWWTSSFESVYGKSALCVSTDVGPCWEMGEQSKAKNIFIKHRRLLMCADAGKPFNLYIVSYEKPSRTGRLCRSQLIFNNVFRVNQQTHCYCGRFGIPSLRFSQASYQSFTRDFFFFFLRGSSFQLRCHTVILCFYFMFVQLFQCVTASQLTVSQQCLLNVLLWGSTTSPGKIIQDWAMFIS